jgi:predicted protein tyrosine phosphatase
VTTTTYTLNRIANCANRFQGKTKKVLCVCSAGLLRSPTAAVVLSQEPFNFNTRAAGLTKEFALIVVDTVLLEWADEIVCMEPEQAATLRRMTEKPIFCLNIPDKFAYRDPKLVDMIRTAYDQPKVEEVQS